MIRKLHVQNFRMLRASSIELGRFRVLAGPAASGRSTVLGCLQLLCDVVTKGATRAVHDLAPSLEDLCFDPQRPIALAAELVPSQGDQPNVRYEVEIGPDTSGKSDVKVAREQVFVLKSASMFDEPPPAQPALFEAEPGEISIIHDRTPRGWRKVVAKSAEGRDAFWDERTDWHSMLRFGVDRSALGSLPDDPERFPISIAVRDFLREGIRTVALDVDKLRAPCAPGGRSRLALDGSNLPFAMRDLQARNPEAFGKWVAQLKVAVPGLQGVDVRERDTDRYLVLEATFDGAHSRPIPSWCLSDALLRLIALTLVPHHLSGREELYLIDEVEAGLHPRGVHVAFEALSTAPVPTQVVCATSSPMLAGRANRDDVLVLKRAADSAAAVLSGDALPDKPSWLEA
ncbi:MAG: hypothetical protein HY898_15990 [Deltaproteobacteria bacterium]|nr:hypothetical protein [Deltaproteobacteria bacterium]